MNLLFIIDHLNNGGAQNQILMLADQLKYDHNVFIFTYQKTHRELNTRGLNIINYNKKRSYSIVPFILLSIYKLKYKIDFSISFLITPNIYNIISNIISIKTKCVISERANYIYNNKTYEISHTKYVFIKLLYSLSFKIVLNSYETEKYFKKKIYLRNKLYVIWNGVDTDKYFYTSSLYPAKKNILCIGRITYQKNIDNIIKALDIFHNNNGYVPEVNWVTLTNKTDKYYLYYEEYLKKYPHIYAVWSWLPPRDSIVEIYQKHYMLLHAPIFEGLPNVVCESLSCGLPVALSFIGDHPRLIKDEHGFLFDPLDPLDISDKINKFMNIDKDTYIDMKIKSRQFALNNLSMNKYVKSYSDLMYNNYK
jgi:glycosyltransferase involved in cell wall biosynthesis